MKNKQEIRRLIWTETESLRDQVHALQSAQTQLLGSIGSLIEFIDQSNWAKETLESVTEKTVLS